VTDDLVLDVLDHLGQNGFSVRHRLADLTHPVLVILLFLDLPRSVSARRTAHLLRTPVTEFIAKYHAVYTYAPGDGTYSLLADIIAVDSTERPLQLSVLYSKT